MEEYRTKAFKINNREDIKKMVTNIVYYMVKYHCIAIVEDIRKIEGSRTPDIKYALIASPTEIFTKDYIRSGEPRVPAIKYHEMSGFALDYSDILKELYTDVWEEPYVYYPYLMKNTEVFKEHFLLTYGSGDLNYIEDLSTLQRIQYYGFFFD